MCCTHGTSSAASLPVPAIFTIHPAPLIEAALYGILTALVFTLWPLARTEDIRPAMLFRDALDGGKALPAWRYVIATLVLLGLLVGVASLFSGSPFLTLWTAGGLIGALIVLVLAAIASRTKRIRLGTAVTVLSTDDPVRVFERFSTLHAISGGRVEMGIGAGWYEHEWRAYGYGFPGAGERLARLRANLSCRRRTRTRSRRSATSSFHRSKVGLLWLATFPR